MKPPETASILAVGSLGVFGFVMYVLAFVSIPDENQQLFSTALGLLGGTMIGSAWGFYFGTTKSSEAKNTAIADQASALRQAAPAAAAAALGGATAGTVQAEGELTLTPSAGRGSQGQTAE